MRAAGPGLAFVALAIASCGDVGSDLITRRSGSVDSCRQNLDCPAERPRCNVDSGRCLQCLIPDDCSDGQACTLPAGTCVPSCLQASCPLTSPSPVCDGSTGLCRGCTTDTECPTMARRCEQTTGRCVECLSGADCQNPELRICDASGRCVECTDPGHCGGIEQCSAVLGRCAIPCSQVGECPPTEEAICDMAIGFCVECRNSNECEPDESCRNSECMDGL